MMEKHKCKLCFRSFSNGRALGGHMRSHVMNHHVPPKLNESQPTFQLSFEAESSSSPSSYSGEEEEEQEEDNKGFGYGLRENPKRSFRFADPEFSFSVAGSVIVQDRESETESSRNVTRKRSERDGKLGVFNKRIKLSQHGNRNESEGSASDTTTEENVAFWLMMLSRDSSSLREINRREKHKDTAEQELEEEEEEDGEDEDEYDLDLDLDLEEDDDEEEEEEEESEEYEEMKNKMKTNKIRGGRYKCETCNRVFRSYQALGGHRASHKKIKSENQPNHEPESMAIDHDEDDDENADNNNFVVPSPSNNFTSNTKKIHECPVCFRVFSSGQALGGHKRTHVLATVPTTAVTRAAAAAEAVAVSVAAANSKIAKLGRESLIDLNLPAPVEDEDDDVSQFEDYRMLQTTHEGFS